MDLILMVVAFGAIMYFLMIRPQQKRMKQHQELIASLQPGSRVLLTSGMFATLRHVGEKQMIVELAPGVEITLLKGNVARVVTEDEEEFEFSDDAVIEADDVDVEGVEGAEEFSADDLEPHHFTEGSGAAEFDPRPSEDDENRKNDN
ncbi:preprotein translocase subunit YajC [Tessaracoccus rhinocerotis]|uniref:Preprotein translocase subunit YajC n=1 Tax=Tessaracoccus rhinocerotis TaxID=1689449 RepID=A0A553JY45_9ACTN|nr:preprotein translocase subunit YajC [Tessaracoccus rhinocerotis]TRY17376.1 preprotein translocase subunit YajC [Tessaracoccus rhinocerotis]